MNRVEGPLVSIVAVCFNHEQFLIETLNSIRSQSYSNVQLIIADDCSKDNSVDVINRWIRKHSVNCELLVHDVNQGVCATLNEAFNLVRGQYYQMIACDDVMLPDKIEKQVSILEKHKELSVIHSSAHRINEDGEVLDYNFILGENLEGMQNSQLLLEGMINSSKIIAPTILYRTKHLPSKPLYDESYLYEDLYLNLRLLIEGRKFYFIDEPLAKYRVSSTSLIRNTELKSRLMSDRMNILRELLLGIDSRIDYELFTYFNSHIGLKQACLDFISGRIGLQQFGMKLRSRLLKKK
ncbi:glycosyltransferase [Roseivirga thermotolerans]|uniref:Glycosyltransferase 2-like domain-containing protein n=2 Tax=Roseivirga TaxID=290180 RepID=A0ABQ3I9Y3_9BACT|nr:glycosyltransferase [Roseivirga thermotolerans]GHE68593.1 hypothetical protein GCM10011340_25490 [Roseivirga thermotolerans]